MRFLRRWKKLRQLRAESKRTKEDIAAYEALEEEYDTILRTLEAWNVERQRNLERDLHRVRRSKEKETRQ